MATTISVSQYITWTQNRLQDPSFDSGVLTQFCQDTDREVCNLEEWPFMEKIFDGTTDTSHLSYNFPSDLQVPINLNLISPDNKAIHLKWMDYRVMDANYPDPTNPANSPQTPWLWSAFGTNFIVGPFLMDQVYTFQLRYLASPVTISGTSGTIDIPDDFAEVVVLGMYRRALRYNDQFDEAQLIDQDYDAALSIMKGRLLKRQTGQNRRMDAGRVPRYSIDDGSWYQTRA